MAFAYRNTLEGEVVLVPAGTLDDPTAEGLQVDASTLELREDAIDGSAVYSDPEGSVEVTFYAPDGGRPVIHSIHVDGDEVEVQFGGDELADSASVFIDDDD
jgi:hypothetical protein